MRTVILSAGQGRRLLPYTAELPKCLLPVNGKPLIEWQLEALAANGIRDVSVVVGFGADKVREVVAESPVVNVETIYNPLFAEADNLISCWMAREVMDDPFVLLNGDTLFHPRVLGALLARQPAPVSVAVSHKSAYDADDMKVYLEGSTLLRVGKDLPRDLGNGESIGMLAFDEGGAALFRDALDEAARSPGAHRRWYLSVINTLAERQVVGAVPVGADDWAEVDFVQDLHKAQGLVASWHGINRPADLSRAGLDAPRRRRSGTAGVPALAARG